MEKTPHFFKIILEDTILPGKLEIPKRFVRRHVNYLQEQVFLKVPNGAKWQVELVKDGDDIWFGNGWQHFVDFYSLSHGSFLVFGFEDFTSFTFNVLIFDKTASEINYPVRVHQDNEAPNLDEQEHSDVDASPLPSRPRTKKKKQKQSQEKRGNGDIFSTKTRPLSVVEKANALERASTFYKTDNPSFSIVMQPSYICAKKEAVTIPASFANFLITKQQGVLVMNSVDAKSWSVRYVSYRVQKTYKVTLMTSGWRKFVVDNHLAVGDVCIFELTNHNASEFKVVISKGNHGAAKSTSEINYPVHVHEDNEDPNLEEQVHQSINEEHIDMDACPLPFSGPCKKRKQEDSRTQSKAKRTQLLTAKEKANALNRSRVSYKSGNPSFSIVMQPTYVSDKRQKVTIPASFANKYCKKERGIIILESVEGKTWCVDYASYRNHKSARLTMMTSGWRKFAEENHLEIGDVCVFEPMNHNASKLKVVICRKNHHTAKSILSIGNAKHLKHKDVPCFKESTSLNPCFKVKIQSAIVNHLINVPAKFMAKRKNRRLEKAKLQVENKVWHVKLLSHTSNYRFSGGVSAFVADNSLKVGDVCAFELINSETMLFKVSISRKP